MQKRFKVGDVVQAQDGTQCHTILGSKRYTVDYVLQGSEAELLRLEGKDGYWAGDCFAVVAEPEFKVGDIVRCIDDNMFYTVKGVDRRAYLTLEDTAGTWRPDHFTLYARVIDRKNPPKCDSMPPVADARPVLSASNVKPSTCERRQEFEAMREQNAKSFAAALDALGTTPVDPHADTVPPPAPAPSYDIGDRVLVKSDGGLGTVLGLDRLDRVVTEVFVEFDQENEHGNARCWFSPEELEPAPSFAPSSEVLRGGATRPGKTAAQEAERAFAMGGRTPAEFFKGMADEACHAAEDRFNETFHALRNNLDAATMNDMLPQALRYNKNKPESDYIFTYEGGISAVFDESFDYYDTLLALRDLYQDECPESLVEGVLEALRQDANDAGDDIIQMLAETNRRGGIKYIPGNYLKGANWRQYFQSGARHAQKLQNGEEWEYDATLVVEAEKKGLYTEDLEKGFPHRGNFFFNVLALCHCIILGIGTDDRIKAP